MTYEEKKRRISLSHHNLTLENWSELLAQFDGKCWNCGYLPADDEGWRALHIDHNHECCHDVRIGRAPAKGARSCGRCIRGLLCRPCNLMIAGYENCKGTLYIPELEKWCAREAFVFSTPLFSEAKTLGLYAGQKRYDR